MNSRSVSIALLAAAILAIPSSLSAATVSGESFDQQSQAIDEGMKLKEDAGVFGRPGGAADEAKRPSAVGDRDLDRYVQRLGYEIRMRNAVSDRDTAGFH